MLESESGVCVNSFRSFLWQIDLKTSRQDGRILFNRNIVRMALRFGCGFQIKQYKLNKGLFPNRQKNLDGLGKYSPSFCRALPGGGNICLEHPHPHQQACWGELVKYGH